MRSTTFIGAVIVGMALAGPVIAAQPAPQALSITFHDDSVSVGGALPSHPIYLFGIAREARTYITRLQPYETRLLDTNGVGKVDFAFKRARSWRSIWFAVDLISGAATAGAPPEYLSNRITLSGKELKKDVGGEIAQIAADGALVEFVVVRPGVGVWGELVASQGPLDEGSDNNKVTLSVFKLQPLAGTIEAAPKKLKKGDVVFILDSFHARYGVGRVGD